MTSHRRHRSPAPPPVPATPLDDDDLLCEILLRIPPQPSSLPRASLVCERWRRLVSDPAFSRRFRARHRRNPPLLGFFEFDRHDPFSFQPTMDPPNRVRRGRFSLPFDHRDCFMPLGCRHGLLLIYHASRNQIVVWDPVTGDRHGLAVPPGFDMKETAFNGAVHRAAGDVHFRVVLVGTDYQHKRALACVYSSETGVWGNRISTLFPSNVSMSQIHPGIPGVLVGDSIYWLFARSSSGILEFDLSRQSLAMIAAPVDMFAKGSDHFRVMRAEGGGLGLLFLSGFSAQLLKRKTDSDGVASWVLGRTIELDKLLPMNLEGDRGRPLMLGYAEENNVVFLWTVVGRFMVQLESLQFEKLLQTNILCRYHHPFESVYAAGI